MVVWSKSERIGSAPIDSWVRAKERRLMSSMLRDVDVALCTSTQYWLAFAFVH